MATEGIDARRIIGVDIEPMGEIVRLVFEESGGGEFFVRLPAKDFRSPYPTFKRFQAVHKRWPILSAVRLPRQVVDLERKLRCSSCGNRQGNTLSVSMAPPN